ncbi:MAG TPA: PQ-loop repeat-containing protein [Gaiellaceae bacterium]|nr:PQ-loop repeat-containing protein [Gaiellaceae bacterium]
MTHEWLGVAAGAWGVAMGVAPALQIREIRRRKSSVGLSLSYMLVLLIGFVLWVAYGVSRNEWPVIVPNAIALAVMTTTIATALKHR